MSCGHQKNRLTDVLQQVAEHLTDHDGVTAVSVFFDPADGHKPTITLEGGEAVSFLEQVGGRAVGPWRPTADPTSWEERDWIANFGELVWVCAERREMKS